MGESICADPECHRPVACRSWCNRHYIQWYRAQRRAGVAMEPTIRRHLLSDVDTIAKTATCAICGPVKISYRTNRGRYQCSAPIKAAAPSRERDDGQTKRQAKRRRWLARYGLTETSYALMLAAQNGGCAICGATASGQGGRSLAIDHSHASGIIRGVLCWHCNAAIGHLRDDPHLAAAAAAYLAEERDGSRWGTLTKELCPKRGKNDLIRPRLTEAEKRRIIELRLSGMYVRTVADVVGRARSTVAAVMRDAKQA